MSRIKTRNPSSIPELSKNVSPKKLAKVKPTKNLIKNERSAKMTSKKLKKKEEEEDQAIKTRRVQKEKTEIGAKCVFCKVVSENEAEEDEEESKKCSKCSAQYHISSCLRYPPEFAECIQELDNWLCPRCIRCSKCSTFIDDPGNRECWSCCRAWHGNCAPRGFQPTRIFDGPWYCEKCCKLKGIVLPGSPKKEGDSTDRRRNQQMNNEIDYNIDIKLNDEEISEILRERNEKHDALMAEAGICSPIKASPRKMFNDRKRVARDDDAKILKKPKRSLFTTTSPSKACGLVEGPANREIGIEVDAEMYNNVHSAWQRNLKNVEKPPENSKDDLWVYFGTDKAVKALSRSAYSEEMGITNLICICKFCLSPSKSVDNFKVHYENCDLRFPPGTEIYRKGNLSFFEIDGAEQTTYCRNLCLLSKLFISSKTLYHEVEQFLFYVLCEITTDGFEMVGYFSKEKFPSKNNNLSCLLTLPTAQKMGYGRLLIDMSYNLSRLERKIGSPEHPLSDLGVLAYRGYWRSSILCYLRSIKGHNNVSIKEISLATRIHPVDIVNQLLRDEMLSFKNGHYYIKTGKRAFKHPLSHCRRRFVEQTKLVWQPKPEDINGLDPNRLNHYAS